MSIAKKLIKNNKQGAQLSNACAALSIYQDQDWENEITIHTFEDGSKVKDCNGFVVII